MQIDEQKVMAFVGQVLADLGGAYTVPMVKLGERLGFYKSLMAGGPATSSELAERTGTSERMVREWLYQQASSGYVDFDPESGRFTLPMEKALVLAVDDAPPFLLGGFDAVLGTIADMDKVEVAFKSGKGMGWGDHSQCIFCATDRLFRASYIAGLVNNWLPALDGVVDRLNAGAKVADVGCGHGTATALIAQAFPKAQVVGYDFHAQSIDHARDMVQAKNLGGNLRFEMASAKDFPGKDFDLICMFDCLHDMGDPVGAAGYAFRSLAPHGTLMVVEPFAEARLVDNLVPRARLAYAASTAVCVPASQAQDVGAALGAQAGPAKIGDVLKAGGFGHIRTVYSDMSHMVLEARRSA